MNKYNVEEYIELLEKEGILKETIECDSIAKKQVNLVSYNSKEDRKSVV